MWSLRNSGSLGQVTNTFLAGAEFVLSECGSVNERDVCYLSSTCRHVFRPSTSLVLSYVLTLKAIWKLKHPAPEIPLRCNKISLFETNMPVLIFLFPEVLQFDRTHALSCFGIASNIFKRFFFFNKTEQGFKWYSIPGLKNLQNTNNRI